jgi:hypothetical protein
MNGIKDRRMTNPPNLLWFSVVAWAVGLGYLLIYILKVALVGR